MSFIDKGLLLAGDVYIAEINNGVKGPLIGPINVNEITITPPTTEEKSRISKKRSTFGQALDSVQLPKDPAKLSLKWDSMTKQLLADAGYEVENRRGALGEDDLIDALEGVTLLGIVATSAFQSETIVEMKPGDVLIIPQSWF